MQISCSTSAFNVDLEEALKNVVSLGFTHADLLAIDGWDHINVGSLLSDFNNESTIVKALVEKYRIIPTSINAAIGALYDRNPEEVALRKRKFVVLARLMKILNVNIISLYPGYLNTDRPWECLLKDTIESLQELFVLSNEYAVAVIVEPHFATPFQTIEQTCTLLHALPELRVAYDPSHFAMQNIDLKATLPILERAAHIHLRDAAVDKMQVFSGTGVIDFEWLISSLKHFKYNGVIAIEYLSTKEFDVAESIIVNRRALSI